MGQQDFSIKTTAEQSFLSVGGGGMSLCNPKITLILHPWDSQRWETSQEEETERMGNQWKVTSVECLHFQFTSSCTIAYSFIQAVILSR